MKTFLTIIIFAAVWLLAMAVRSWYYSQNRPNKFF